MIDFCKAKRYIDQEVHVVQPKLDGWHIMAYWDAIFTRKPVDITDKLAWMNIEVPLGTILVGELYCEEEEATSVPTLVNDKDSRLKFQPFAVPFHNFKDLTYATVEEGNKIIEELGWAPLVTRPFKNTDANNLVAAEMWRQAATDNKVEGFMAKNWNYAEWYKIKPLMFVDCKIISVSTSTSPTHYGDMKAMIVAVPYKKGWKTIASVGSGFEAEFRNTVNRKNLIGRIVEVQYDGLAAGGKLKFPRFVRFREDKSDCTNWEEVCDGLKR